MDIPTNPIFSIPQIGNSVLDPIQFDFTLLNMDENALMKNFEFLHALFAGTQWLQFPGGTIKSTNVYNVYCPGRFHIFWAALDMSVKADGKLRKCTEMKEKYTQIKSIDDNTLWPEVWKVTIQIKSLTPNNFNAYIHHFVHGFAEGTVKLLAGNHSEENIAKLIEYNDPLKELSANGSLNLGLTKEERAERMVEVKAASELNFAERKKKLLWSNIIMSTKFAQKFMAAWKPGEPLKYSQINLENTHSFGVRTKNVPKMKNGELVAEQEVDVHNTLYPLHLQQTQFIKEWTDLGGTIEELNLGGAQEITSGDKKYTIYTKFNGK